MTATIISSLRQQTNLYQKYGLIYLALFGSYARNQQLPDSDIDVLVDFDEPKSFFELADIQFSLEKILGQKVDLVMKRSVKKNLLPYIRQDLISVYEKR